MHPRVVNRGASIFGHRLICSHVPATAHNLGRGMTQHPPIDFISYIHRCSTDARAPNNGVELTLQSLSSNEGDILHLTPMETQHPNNVVDLMLFQLYCHLASNPNGNATSRRLSTRPDDLTQVLVCNGYANAGMQL